VTVSQKKKRNRKTERQEKRNIIHIGIDDRKTRERQWWDTERNKREK